MVILQKGLFKIVNSFINLANVIVACLLTFWPEYSISGQLTVHTGACNSFYFSVLNHGQFNRNTEFSVSVQRPQSDVSVDFEQLVT